MLLNENTEKTADICQLKERLTSSTLKIVLKYGKSLTDALHQITRYGRHKIRDSSLQSTRTCGATAI